LMTRDQPQTPPCKLRTRLLNRHYGCLQPLGSVLG
jgi:hypothetical protein